MSSSEGNNSGPSTPKKAKKQHYKQKFRDEWLSEINFKNWLQRDPNDPYRAICSSCDTKILADRIAIKRHGEGNKHLKKTKPLSSQPSIATVFDKKTLKSEDKRKTAEIKLAAFMAEHKIAFHVMDHLVDLIPKIFSDSEVAKNLKMKRTKLQAVINNVLGSAEKEALCVDLKKQKFSVMIDESTDIGAVKTMCVVVRHYCSIKGRIVSRFWDLIQLYGEDKTSDINASSATAEHLFEAVLKSFEDNSIPIENIIGFASDGCNTMMGCNNSVSSRFRAKCPGITVLKCVCHSLHLCASDACKQLPAECEKLAREIYNYFSTSSKRQSEFKDFQEFTETDVHKILKPAQTRWLSLSSVVERILEQWNALTLFFNGRWLEDNECHEIHRKLIDPTIKAYFFFLNWMLPKFTHVNTLFQSETPMITKINSKMNDLYFEILSTYVQRSYITGTDLDKVDPTSEQYFKGLDDIYLGLGVQKQLSSNEIPIDKKMIVKMKCRNFLINACVGIRKRYALNDPVLMAISKLDPENCIDSSRQDESLQNLMIMLPRLAPTSMVEQQELDDQWRKLPKLKDRNVDTTQQIDIFWHMVKQIEGYSLIAEFMLNILALPNSNAECERVFSQINDIKTKKRNRLITKTIRGNMLAKQTIIRHGDNCVNFQPTDSMIKALDSGIYKKETAIGLNDSDTD